MLQGPIQNRAQKIAKRSRQLMNYTGIQWCR